MGFNKLLIGFAMTLLFTIAIISYVTMWGADNGAFTNLANDSTISILKTDTNTQLGVMKTTVNSSSDAFADSTIATGGETLESGSVFKTPFGFFDGIKNIFSVGRTEIFGNDSNDGFGIIFTVLGTILVVLITTATWKLWKGGLPE